MMNHISNVGFNPFNEVTELLAVLEMLPQYVEQHGIRLVVIDSVAFHFRQDFRDMALRTTILVRG